MTKLLTQRIKRPSIKKLSFYLWLLLEKIRRWWSFYFILLINDLFEVSKHFHFRILKVDPYNAACLPLHIAVLKMLNKPNGQFAHCSTASLFHFLQCSLRRISELFYLGHRLVDLYPKKPVIKFVVVSLFLINTIWSMLYLCVIQVFLGPLLLYLFSIL